MKGFLKKKRIGIFSTLFLFFFLLFLSAANSVHAAIAATLALNSVNTATAQINVSGDAYSLVELHYGHYASTVTTLGSTDGNGYLTITVSTNSYNISCDQTAFVIVNGQRSQTIPWTNPNDTTCGTTNTNTQNHFSFDRTNIVMNVGESQTVGLSGVGGYTVSNNSSPVIGATISGNTVSLHANNFGGSDITICQNDGQCGVLYVVAVQSGASQNNSTPTSLAAPSFSVSSNISNGQFLGTGNLLTLALNGNGTISNVSFLINGSLHSASGGGNGPYTTVYSVTGNELLPIPVTITYVDSSSVSRQVDFAIGRQSTVTNLPPVSQPTPTPTPVPAPAAPPAPVVPKYIFTSFISIDSSGTEVTELQKRLTTLGFYSGPLTGYFGALTEAAVKKFQKTYSITQAGYVGPSTRAKLNTL